MEVFGPFGDPQKTKYFQKFAKICPIKKINIYSFVSRWSRIEVLEEQLTFWIRLRIEMHQWKQTSVLQWTSLPDKN